MQQENTIKIQCSNCHQQLRIPYDRGNLKINCPTCKASGIWGKDSKSNNDLDWLLNSSSEEINRGSISLMDTSMASGNFTSGFVNPNKYKLPYYIEASEYSSIGSIFCDPVSLEPGSIVVVSLGTFLDHTGIYVGNNEVIELFGNGHIRSISFDHFLFGGEKEGDFSPRTGLDVFTATYKDKVIHSEDIKNRAIQLKNKKIKYDILKNNCHMMSGYCFSGRDFQKNTDCKFFSGLTKKIMDTVCDKNETENENTSILSMFLGDIYHSNSSNTSKKTYFSWKKAKPK